MSWRTHLLLVSSLALPMEAQARKPHRRPALALRIVDPQGPRWEYLTSPRLVLAPEELPYTFFEECARQIALGMVLFDPNLALVMPLLGTDDPDLVHDRMNLVPPRVTDDASEQEYERAQVTLAASPVPPSAAALGLAMALFTGLSVAAIGSPRALNPLKDGRLHIGAATFDYGGLGLAVRARLRLGGG